MESSMLAPTRTIGGKKFTVRRMNNYLGADYIIVADVTTEQLATLGAPDQMNTYLRCQGKTYRWFNNAWIDFFPVGDGNPGPAGMSAYQIAVSRGYSGTLDQWLVSLNGKDGEPGRMGLPGDQGPPGPAASLSIGTVTSGATPKATISGTPPNQSLSLVLPRGDTGSPGPGNTLSIGTVTTLATGQPATASVNGSPPNQTLDLGIPAGPAGVGAKGDPGPANSLSIGTVRTVAAGNPAAASITGTPPAQTLNLDIPVGAQGVPGSAGTTPTLSIGSVTTLASGSSATASISGGAISLGIPRGADGNAGTLTIGTVSTGSPGSAASAAIVSGKLNLTIPGSKRIDTYVGTTDANGLFSVTYPTPFAEIPSVQPVPPALPNQVWVLVSSTVSGFSLRLTQRNVTSLLGIEVLLGATVNVSAAAARVTVIQA